jgi:hypothetical protein
MSDPNLSNAGAAGREEVLSELFAQMVIQHANLARMMMGRTPHPQSGETMQDLDGARMFIDQLEMLEAKTKGNLTRDEEMLLKQSLMSLRLAFVEAVEAPAPSRTAAGASPGPAAPADSAPGAEARSDSTAAPDSGASSATEAESKKKFTKKY